MVGGITEEEKERLLDKLDAQQEQPPSNAPIQPSKISPLKTTHIIQRKEKQIKTYNKMPVLLYPIQNKTYLREDILVVLANDKPHPFGVQAGDIWIELNKRTSVKNVKKAIYALEQQGFLTKSKVNNIISKKECPLYALNPKIVTIKKVPEKEGSTAQTKPPEAKAISTESVKVDAIAERMTDIEWTNNQIIKILKNNEHILPIIEEMHKMRYTFSEKLKHLDIRIDMQNQKNTKFLSHERLKDYYDGQFSILDEEMTKILNPIGKQLGLEDLEKSIRRLKKINMHHVQLFPLYEDLINIYANLYATYRDREKKHILFEKEIWERLTAPQRKQERENDRLNRESLARMKESDENVEE